MPARASIDLLPGEKLIRRMRQHWIALVRPAFGFIISTAGYIAVLAALNSFFPDRTDFPWFDWAFALGYAVLLLRFTARGLVSWITTVYLFTDNRIITRSGLLVVRGESIPLNKVNSIQFEKTLFERFIGSGSLTIESAAANEVRIKHVTGAEELQLELDAIMSADARYEQNPNTLR